MSLRLYKKLEPIWVESSEFSQVSGHLYCIRFALPSPRSNTWGEARNFSISQSIYRKKAIYDDSYLASLGVSKFQIQCIGMTLGIFSSPRACIMKGELGIFLSPKAYLGVSDPIYRHISLYFVDIFLHY